MSATYSPMNPKTAPLHPTTCQREPDDIVACYQAINHKATYTIVTPLNYLNKHTTQDKSLLKCDWLPQALCWAGAHSLLHSTTSLMMQVANALADVAFRVSYSKQLLCISIDLAMKHLGLCRCLLWQDCSDMVDDREADEQRHDVLLILDTVSEIGSWASLAH